MEIVSVSDTELYITQGLMGGAGLFYLISFIIYCVWMCKEDTYLKQYGAGPVGKAALAMAFLGGGLILLSDVTLTFVFKMDTHKKAPHDFVMFLTCWLL